MHDDGYLCPVCEQQLVFGEDDLSQRARPDSGGGSNVLSLNDSKKAYHKQ